MLPPKKRTVVPMILLIIGLFSLGYACGYFVGSGWNVRVSGRGAACTLEAKICPDGSSVGRTGPNCEFSPCPQDTRSLDTPAVLPSESIRPTGFPAGVPSYTPYPSAGAGLAPTTRANPPVSVSCGGWDTSGEVVCRCSGTLTKPVCPPNTACDSITYQCAGTCSNCCFSGIAENPKYPRCPR